mmetsp:Transcript_26178/g.83112  ORF Transcript_26178/g.83112 Transcript_26178/m.83112 type:complete len:117 (+) Transcript_26178:1-351(+)
MRSIKDYKKDFRKFREDYDAAKARKDDLASERSQVQGMLLDDFQTWFAAATQQQNRESKREDVEEDMLDDGEQFDKLELERVHAEDPESVAFFKATKAQRERQRRARRAVQQSRRV